MKHLETYENIENKQSKEPLYQPKEPLYQIDDYVVLTEEALETNGIHDIYENIGMIRNKTFLGSEYMYDVDYLRNDFNFENIHDFYLLEEEIDRKLTLEEIEDLQTYIASKKYNL